jgi:group I intron endonuclease
MFIYQITNLITNKIYIGMTQKTLDERFKGHLKSKTKTSKIANSIQKYGKENFKIELLDTATTFSELCDKEKFWIKKNNSMDPEIGYNLRSGGFGGGIQTPEMKSKIKETKSTKEWKNKVFNSYSKANSGSKNPRSKMYTITYHDGRQEKIHCLKEFCDLHGYSYESLCLRRTGKSHANIIHNSDGSRTRIFSRYRGQLKGCSITEH